MLVLSRTSCVALLLICVVFLLFEGCCSSNDPIGTQDDQHCIPGDVDANGLVDRDDVEFLAMYIFKGGPAPTPLCCGDADGSGILDIDDPVYLVQVVFGDGPPPIPDACENWPH